MDGKKLIFISNMRIIFAVKKTYKVQWAIERDSERYSDVFMLITLFEDDEDDEEEEEIVPLEIIKSSYLSFRR